MFHSVPSNPYPNSWLVDASLAYSLVLDIDSRIAPHAVIALHNRLLIPTLVCSLIRLGFVCRNPGCFDGSRGCRGAIRVLMSVSTHVLRRLYHRFDGGGVRGGPEARRLSAMLPL